MGLFDRGGDIRLGEHRPEKEKKQREVRPYKPPKPLSWLSCGILIVLSLALLAYAAVTVYMRLFGVCTEAAVFTALDEYGAVTEALPVSVTSTLPITFADEAGALHAAGVSIMGNFGGIGDTVAIRYLPSNPERVMLASQTDEFMIPFGSILLGAVLFSVAQRRLREIFGTAKEDAPET